MKLILVYPDDCGSGTCGEVCIDNGHLPHWHRMDVCHPFVGRAPLYGAAQYGPQIRPFSCGTEFMMWEDANCCYCERSGMSDDGDYTWGKCAMEDELSEGCIGDGQVGSALAHEYGWRPDPEYGYPVAPRRCTHYEEAS